MYSPEKDEIYKDFIKCGFKFVKEYVTAGNKVEDILETAVTKVEQSQLTSDSPKDRMFKDRMFRTAHQLKQKH